MSQKYKFFIKDKAVTFRESENVHRSSLVDESAWIGRLEKMDLNEDTDVILQDLDGFLVQLQRSIPIITAGGGFVKNGNGEILFIHRRGFWDLPKGKAEPGETIEETAMREVEEECGIGGLSIISPPFETYHLYAEKGKTYIKRSVWFEMSCSDQGELTPQTEEDITEVRWIKPPISNKIIDGAYASIREVLGHFGA